MVGIGPEQLESWLFHVEPYLAKLPSDSGYLAADVLDRVRSRDMQLWTGPQFVIVTEVYKLPQFKMLNLFFVVGESMHVWMDEALETLEKYALSIGCDRIQANGRKGWLKHMQKCGFEDKQILFRKVLK